MSVRGSGSGSEHGQRDGLWSPADEAAAVLRVMLFPTPAADLCTWFVALTDSANALPFFGGVLGG